MKFRFVADEPIDKSDLDILGFSPFVSRIEAALADTATPFVYGLLGPWGSGKTSVQKLLASKFREDLKAKQFKSWVLIPVWLDAWRYENQDNMIFPLLHAFRQSRSELINDSTANSGFLQGLRDVAAASAIALLDLGLRAATKKAFGEAIKFSEIKEHVDEVIDKPDEIEQLLSAWTQQVEGLRGKYEAFIATYAAELAENLGIDAARVRFILFIDDLDRCLPNVAVGLLESIKNHLSVPGCIYILGINPAVIARGIRAKYAGLEIGGREYLEKILNYSFSVPVPDADALKNFGVARLSDLLIDENDREKFHSALASFGEALAINGFNNPRKIKRILNSYLLFIATQEMLNRFDLKYITKLIVLAEYYPELFRLADRGALEDALRVFKGSDQANSLTANRFQSTYGLALDGPLAELASMPNLLSFPILVGPEQYPISGHISAVRAVCGRV